MSLKSSNKVETNRYEITVEVDGETFEKEVNRVYKKEVKRINIPGFRKGKAPRALIEKEYGSQVFYEDAMKALYPEALENAVKEAGLTLVRDKIELDVVEAGKDGFVFKAVVTVEPELSIDNYKGIGYVPMSLEITEDDIDNDVKRVQERNSRLVPVEGRAAENGDIAVIDFEGFLNGEAFDGGKAENYSLTLGNGQFIPGFEEQIVGHNIDEEFTINVTFPEDYQADELAGKETEFKIKLHEIKKRELPEVDDEFIKDVSEFDNVADYRNDIKQKLEKSRKEEAENSKNNQIAEKLAGLLVAEIPEAMYENQIDNLIGEFEMNLRAQGLDINTYMQYVGVDEDGLREQYRERAESQVKVRLALKAVADIENIAVTDDEIDEEYKRVAEAYNVDVDRVKSAFSTEDIANDLKSKKAMELVRENAVEVEDAESSADSAE